MLNVNELILAELSQIPKFSVLLQRLNQYTLFQCRRQRGQQYRRRLTFPHDARELPGDVALRDGRGRGLAVAGRGVVGLEALRRQVLVPRLGVRGHQGGAGHAVVLDGSDDDLLQLLQRVPQVPSLQDVLP